MKRKRAISFHQILLITKSKGNGGGTERGILLVCSWRKILLVRRERSNNRALLPLQTNKRDKKKLECKRRRPKKQRNIYADERKLVNF